MRAARRNSCWYPDQVGEADSADLLAMIAVSCEQDPKGWGYCDSYKFYAYRWLVVVGTHMYSDVVGSRVPPKRP